MYDVRDVLKKAIDIANRKKTMLEKASEDAGDVRMRMLIAVFIKTVEKDIQHYESMIANITDAMAEAIEFSVYDKISFLVNQFFRTLHYPKIKDQKSFVQYAIEQEKSIYALLVDIQGRMVTNEAIVNTIAYYALTEVIENKKKNIEHLENFMR